MRTSNGLSIKGRQCGSGGKGLAVVCFKRRSDVIAFASVPNFEAAEFTSCRAGVDPFTPNVVEKPFPYVSQEGIDFLPLPLDNQLNTSIGKVLHIARNVEPARERVRRVAKPDTLHMARK